MCVCVCVYVCVRSVIKCFEEESFTVFDLKYK